MEEQTMTYKAKFLFHLQTTILSDGNDVTEKREIHSPCNHGQYHGPSDLVHTCHTSLQWYWGGRYSGHWWDHSYYQIVNRHRLDGNQKQNRAKWKLPPYISRTSTSFIRRTMFSHETVFLGRRYSVKLIWFSKWFQKEPSILKHY